ncbi:MAG: hypothetical protein EAY75_07740 [Bacteroidetes bacterium]|nr:MAG: hypothetical protein EAY75_07740 [Bacteroidota bacterium]
MPARATGFRDWAGKAYKKITLQPVEKILDVGANKGRRIDFFKGAKHRDIIWGIEPNKTALGLFNKDIAKKRV